MRKLLFFFFYILLFNSGIRLKSEEPSSSWLVDKSVEAGLTIAKGGRVSLVDINNDNYPDLIWGKGGINKNDLHIMLNIPNPNQSSNLKRIFVDWTDSSGINQSRKLDTNKHTADIAAFVDLNNDGNVDFITSIYYHRLQMYQGANDPGDRSEVYLGDGKGHFTLLENNGLYQLGLTNTTGLGFLDFDLDGVLDLFMGQWFYDYAIDQKQSSILMKGNGDGSFARVNSSAIDNNIEPLYGTNVTDWDNDGYQDIITSPYCRSGGSLYKTNNSGLFFDVAAAANYSAQTMQGDNGQNLCQWESQAADFDCDGDMDLLQVQVHGGYNTGEGRTHISVNQGPENNFRFAWEMDRLQRIAPPGTHLGDQGGQWVDVDGDGLLDIAIGQMAYSDANRDGQERLYICLQNSDNYFDDKSIELDVFKYKEAHSVEPADFDLDGDQDIFFSRQHRDTTYRDTVIDGTPTKVQMIDVYMQITLLQNEIGNSNNWVSVLLEAPDGQNKAGIGARIKVFADGHNQIREIQAGLGHFASQQPFIQNISLGDRNRIDSIQVRWQMPGFPVTTIYNPPINLIHKIYFEGMNGYLTPWEGAKPVIAVKDPFIDFGKVIADESVTKSVKVQNIGDAAMTINSITLINNPKTPLNLKQVNLPINIPPMGEIELEITFEPQSRDTLRSFLIIGSNAVNANEKLIDIYGNGFKEEAIIGLSDTEIKYHNALVGQKYDEIIKIYNFGEKILDISRVTLEGIDKNYFSFMELQKNSINPMDSTYIVVSFEPDAMRTFTCLLKIQSNAYNYSEYSISINGECNGPTQEIFVKGGLLFFGTVAIGSTESKSIIIQNVGIGPLLINEIYPEENLDNAFIVFSESMPITLNSNDTTTVRLEFTPAKQGSYKTRLVIESNSIKDSVKYLNINATGGPVGIEYSEVKDSSFFIFPNPASDFIEVEFYEGESIEYEIFDILGRKVTAGVTGGRIQISHLKQGVYLLKPKNLLPEKFIKQ